MPTVLIGRPYVNVFYIDKLILPSIAVAITFMLNDEEFIISPDGQTFKPKIVIIIINLLVLTKQMFGAT